MQAKKLTPKGAGPRSEPDLSHAPTRKVDSVSSLAAEMMLRQADEGGAASSPPPPPLSVTRPSWEPSVRSSVRPTPARSRDGSRAVVLAVVGLALILLGAAAALVLSR